MRPESKQQIVNPLRRETFLAKMGQKDSYEPAGKQQTQAQNVDDNTVMN